MVFIFRIFITSSLTRLEVEHGSNPKRNVPRKESSAGVPKDSNAATLKDRSDSPSESPAAHIFMRESTILEFLKTPPRRNSPVNQPFKPVQPSDPNFRKENRRLDVSSNPVRQARDIDVAELNRISKANHQPPTPQTYTRARKMTSPAKDANRFTFLSDRKMGVFLFLNSKEKPFFIV